MKLSTKGRYGMRAMLDLALHYGQGPTMVKDIAGRQEISERYLEHLLISLKAAGMVRSTRGTRGGFSLTAPPSQIRLSEIVRALEGSLAPVDCVDDPGACTRSQSCVTRDLWMEMRDSMESVLSSMTLQELAEREADKKAASYQI